MDQNDYRCCGGQNFRFDGQHIICNKCGGVLIQETKSQEQIEKEQVAAKKKHMKEKKRREEEERKRYTLQGHYDSMMGFDEYLNIINKRNYPDFENDEFVGLNELISKSPMWEGAPYKRPEFIVDNNLKDNEVFFINDSRLGRIRQYAEIEEEKRLRNLIIKNLGY